MGDWESWFQGARGVSLEAVTNVTTMKGDPMSENLNNVAAFASCGASDPAPACGTAEPAAPACGTADPAAPACGTADAE